jgi:hypothetical protein
MLKCQYFSSWVTSRGTAFPGEARASALGWPRRGAAYGIIIIHIIIIIYMALRGRSNLVEHNEMSDASEH